MRASRSSDASNSVAVIGVREIDLVKVNRLFLLFLVIVVCPRSRQKGKAVMSLACMAAVEYEFQIVFVWDT